MRSCSGTEGAVLPARHALPPRRAWSSAVYAAADVPLLDATTRSCARRGGCPSIIGPCTAAIAAPKRTCTIRRGSSAAATPRSAPISSRARCSSFEFGRSCSIPQSCAAASIPAGGWTTRASRGSLRALPEEMPGPRRGAAAAHRPVCCRADAGEAYIAANRALDRDLERLTRAKAELVAALRSPPHEDFVDAGIRQFCASARARFQACVDFDAKRFSSVTSKRVIYNRYTVTIAGSVPVQSASVRSRPRPCER